MEVLISFFSMTSGLCRLCSNLKLKCCCSMQSMSSQSFVSKVASPIIFQATSQTSESTSSVYEVNLFV